MVKRLQVTPEGREYRGIQRMARFRLMSFTDWVRQAIGLARHREPGSPSFSRTLRKGRVMGIIGALYERGRCRSQQEIPRGRQPWNPTLQKTKGGAPGPG